MGNVSGLYGKVLMQLLGYILLGLSGFIALANIISLIGSHKESTHKKYRKLPSMIALVSLLFVSISYFLIQDISPLIFIIAILDPGSWVIVLLPFSYFKKKR